MKIKSNKTVTYIIASLFIGFVVFNNLEQKETLEAVDKPKPKMFDGKLEKELKNLTDD